MDDFPLPPLRRGSTPVAGMPSSLLDGALPVPALHPLELDFGEEEARSVSPSCPRRSSKRVQGGNMKDSPVSSPMSASWSSSTASSTGTIGQERARDVKLSLDKLEGIAAIVVIPQEEHHESTSPVFQDSFAGGAGAKGGSSSRPYSRPSSSSSRNLKSNGTSSELRELARAKRRQGTGSSISSRNSSATLQSMTSSTGSSIYEDAVEYRSEDEEAGRDGSSDAEDAIVLINGVYPSDLPSTPPPKPFKTVDSREDLPPPLASPPLFRPVFGAAAKLDLEQQKKLLHRRQSLQAEYNVGPRQTQRQSLQLEPSDTIIPVRRYSAIPKGFEPASPNRRHSHASAPGSPSSNGDISSSTIVPASPESRRSSFQLKPLVLTPQRTLIAQGSPTSLASPSSLGRRRLSDQFVDSPNGRSLHRNGSLNAGRPTSPFDRPISPISYGSAPLHNPSRRRSLGYFETSTLLGRRDSGSSSHGGNILALQSGAGNPAWSRSRSASEDTGSTQLTAQSSLLGDALPVTDGESPDSSRGSWSDAQEADGRASPALNDREWEQEYYKRSITPLCVLEEERQVEQWDADGKAIKRRTRVEEDEDVKSAPQVTQPNASPLPLIELSQSSPKKADSTPRDHPVLANGLPHSASSQLASEHDQPSPSSPPKDPSIPSFDVLNSRRPSAKSIKSVKSTKSSKSGNKTPRILQPAKYDEHWNGEAFVEVSPSVLNSPMGTPSTGSTTPRQSATRTPSLKNKQQLEDGAIPPVPTYRPIQIRTTSDSSVQSTRKLLKLERTDISPVQQQGEFAASEVRHAKSFSHNNRLQKNLGAKGTRSSSELRKGSKNLEWPPEGTTMKVSAGPRILTPGEDSDDSGPPSPILYYKEEDFDRPQSYLRRPTLEPRDPRARVNGPDSFLEVLLSTEPPSATPPVRKSAFDSFVRPDDTVRWSAHSVSTTATSQLSTHIPGQRRDEDSSPSSSPTKGTLAKRFFGSFSKEKRRKSESSRSALENAPHTRQPIQIAAAQPVRRPISIPSRSIGSPPRSLPASTLASRRGSAASDATRTGSSGSHAFIPRQAPISPLFAHPAQLDSSSSQEELSDFDPRLSSTPPARFVPRSGPVDDHVEEKLMEYIPGRASMSSAGSDPHLASEPRAYQLPPGLGGPLPSSRPRSQYRKGKQDRSGSISSDQEAYQSRSLPFGVVPPSPTSSADGSQTSQQRFGGTRRASAPNVGGTRRGSDTMQPLPERRRGSRDSQLLQRQLQAAQLQQGLPYGVRDVMRSQFMDR